MKLWGGRFTKETNQLVHNFNASISFDQKFYKQDIDGSIAHVNMLAKQNIVTNEERFAILNALEQIKTDIDTGVLEISPEYEDIHSFVEATLIERIGDTGKNFIQEEAVMTRLPLTCDFMSVMKLKRQMLF